MEDGADENVLHCSLESETVLAKTTSMLSSIRVDGVGAETRNTW